MEFEINNFKIFYRLKKLTSNQINFISDLLNSINNKKISIFEFPPTLDKTYLYNSVLYTLSKDKNHKFVIIVKSYDKIFEILKNFSSILSNKLNKNKNINITPFIDRKSSCINEIALENSSTLDYDMYCTKITASWVPKNSKCPYYNNYIENKSIEYETEEYENRYNYLVEKKICPFYYNLYSIKNNPDIVITTYKDYFDPQARISISNILKDYVLILDDCDEIDFTVTNLYNMNIDNNLLINATNQIFYLKDFSENKGNMLIDSDPDSSEMEIINYNILCKDVKYSGVIKKTKYFLNLLSRLISIIRKVFLVKEETIWNIYSFQYQLLTEWIDFRTIEGLFKRLIDCLNSIQFTAYEDIYHLFTCTIFLNKLALLVNDYGFILSYQKYSGSDITFLELYCIEPYNLINKIFKFEYYLLGSSIGNLDIYESILKITADKFFYNDDLSHNLYLTNISSTNANNNSFYGEIIRKLCKSVPDGIICYFSSISLMEYYIKKWNEQDVFNTVMNDKLIFIEEQDPIKLSHILVNYKKACDMGRGSILFLSTRNRASLTDYFTSHQSRCIIFIGFPIQTKLTKKFELKLENIKKQFNLENKEFLNLDTFRLFSTKISEKINDMYDKKILVVLDEKLMSEKLKEYLPSWLRKIIHEDYDKENINTDERLKNIKKFLDN